MLAQSDNRRDPPLAARLLSVRLSFLANDGNRCQEFWRVADRVSRRAEPGKVANVITIVLGTLLAQGLAPADRPMVVVDERTVRRTEPPPHGAIGQSTAYRISDAVPGRIMEFRKRVLHRGAAIGVHPIDHDEVYYVLSGRGEVESGGERRMIGPGMAAYLFTGERVGIRQVGRAPLTLIISFPLPARR